MGERIIVGAGLSGLVAAITLARRGRKVRVLEKYKTVGGQPERWPAVDVTPMEPEKLGRYIGIPLGEPQIKECRSLDAYIWGKKFRVPVSGSTLCCVERGARKTALDRYLYNLAESEGVSFEFEQPVIGQGRLSALPPDTIIATGLYAESFDALHIPYQNGRCYGAKGKSERDAEAVIYFNEYTTDYGYWSAINGIDMIFLFKRGPISRAGLASYERELESTEGLKAGEWLEGYGPTPTVTFDNPRLFASDKILAGTLSGMLEPFVLFGLHGALVSGKIAALAVEDRNEAFIEFRRCLHGWKRMLLRRKIYDHVPSWARRAFILGLNEVLGAMPEGLGAKALREGFSAVPGYRRIREMS
jgi:flavin-dependent dehydrogenase